MGCHSGASSGAGKTQSGIAPKLNNELVRKANEASVTDIGNSTARQYQRNVDTITNDYTYLSDDERKEAITKLHTLTEQQLQAESQRVNPYATGRGVGRFDRQLSQSTGDKAIDARLKVEDHMKAVRELNQSNHRKANQKAMTEAMKKAIETGALSFTINGVTYKRKSTRAKTFST